MDNEQKQRERTVPAALHLRVDIATGGYFEFDCPAATISYERGEEVRCSVEDCLEPPTINRDGSWYCQRHDPNSRVLRAS